MAPSSPGAYLADSHPKNVNEPGLQLAGECDSIHLYRYGIRGYGLGIGGKEGGGKGKTGRGKAKCKMTNAKGGGRKDEG